MTQITIFGDNGLFYVISSYNPDRFDLNNICLPLYLKPACGEKVDVEIENKFLNPNDILTSHLLNVHSQGKHSALKTLALRSTRYSSQAEHSFGRNFKPI